MTAIKMRVPKPYPYPLRVWWILQVPSNNPFRVPVKDVFEAKLLMETLANYDLYQLKNNIKPDYSNAGGVEMLEDGEWTDFCDEDGNDFDEHWEEIEATKQEEFADG